MNALVFINGVDNTESCLLETTRINYDSTRRITTATITLIGTSPGAAARYDEAVYDLDYYGIDVAPGYPVVILDGRDGVTKLFAGRISGLALKQTDGTEGYAVYYECDLNDYGSMLDRSVAWDDTFIVPMPASDKVILEALLGEFAPGIILAHVEELVPAIMKFEYKGKTCRQVLDDLAALTLGEWNVDFDARLWYGAAANAPAAPYELSTSPDGVTSFPVRVDGFKRDFSNPVNHAYVRGAINPATGIIAQADYQDPVSIGAYGEYAYSVVDDQITETYDAELRAKTTVLKYAYPIEQGEFTVWTDDLAVGQRVALRDESLAIDGAYIIRSLSLTWRSKELVEYRAQFGAAQPDLESYLRLLDQRSRWKTANQAASSIPAPGSVTDASIAPPGLSAGSIQSVNANTILGSIQASQIGAVNAGVIVGQVQASQIATVNASSIQGTVQAEQIGAVNATSIQGAIQAGQIGSVAATTIQGVVVSSQLADGILDTLSKYAGALRPVQVVKASTPWPPAMPNANYPAGSYFWYEPDGHFYKINPDGLTWTDAGTNPDALTGSMSFYTIGRLSAQNLTGLIVAAQIQNLNASQIIGAIQAGQIASVTAGQITGTLTATQISSVNASTVQGTLTASQIGSVNASAIAGQLSAGQIASVNATTITGTIVATQISSINGNTINIGTVGSDKLTAFSLDIGGGGGKPGRLNVYDGGNNLVAQLGTLDQVGGAGSYGGWFKLFGAGGSSFADAKIKSDAGGNLAIKDAALTITSGTYSLYTSPTTFDASYGSLALVNEQSPDKAAFISRGIVVYYSGSNVAALVRSPSGGWGELTLQGGGYIFMSGQTGLIRADGGYSVSGTLGVTENVVAGSVTLKFLKGMYIGHT